MTELERIARDLCAECKRFDKAAKDSPFGVAAARAQVTVPLLEEAIDLLARAIYRAERIA